MKLNLLKEKLHSHVEQIEDLIELMPHKGDKCSDSQKLCLTQAINEFEHSINGITTEQEEDLKDEEE